MITTEDIKNKFNLNGNKTIIALALVAALPIFVFLIYTISGEEKEVLFSGMSEKDMTNVTMLLDEKRIPYTVDLDTSSINVSKKDVRSIRMSIMSNGAILDSNVGFEIFNDAEFGMTEFSQKINFQRAIQGELARTISALSEIKYARVHIVQPKNKLFKSKDEKSSASIILFLKNGAKLSDEQISGIQNIVSSSIEQLKMHDVVITNQSGVVLSKSTPLAAENYTNKFSKKEKVEKFYKDKVMEILDNSFAGEKFVASVNVEFDYTKSSIQKESYINTPAAKAVKREKISVTKKTGATTKDIEYKIGRRIENVEPEKGRIKRISIGIIVPKSVSESQMVKLKKVIAMAIGIIPERGDNIELFSDDLSTKTESTTEIESMIVKQQEITEQQTNTTDLSSNIVVDSLLNLVKGNHVVLISIMSALVILLSVLTLIFVLLPRKVSAKLSVKEKEKIVSDLSEWFSSGK